MPNSSELGAWGETQAAEYLTQRGFCLLARNYHSRWGEIDLILEGHGFLVFAEVKLRKSARYGTPGAYVTAAKQEKLRQTALQYLQQNPTALQPRFDVVELYAPRGMDLKSLKIHHIENAF